MLDEIDLDWTYHPPTRRSGRAGVEDRLEALRQDLFKAALASIRPRRIIRVSTYVLAGPGSDAEATHHQLRQFATSSKWRPTSRFFTDHTDVSLLPAGTRPGFDQVCDHVGFRLLDGILTTSRQALPATTTVYEDYLRWLGRRQIFVAYAQPTFTEGVL
ncbi:hypothetical protein OG923_33935 (plasmid) [Streptomyces halstedii]|uniref:hypothetical protein n=1 Tax=Streptomyces halstedii TaxID=1944 RepID=UPI002F90D1E2